MKWTQKKVKLFLNWYHTTIIDSKLKLNHKLAPEFLFFIWDDFNKEGKISSFFLAELYKADVNGIILDITGAKEVQLSELIRCQGYFDSGNMLLTAATGHRLTSKWLSTLVHETCHMDQYLENPMLWKRFEDAVNIDEWIDGKKFPRKEIEESIDLTQEVELDCEIRAIKKMRKYKLPIDTTDYIKKVNAYVYFYQYLKETRTWPREPKSPYCNAISSKMPDQILSKEQYLILPKEIRDLFRKHL